MRIAGIITGTRANGPGLRTTVWFQGCQGMGSGGQGHCEGCWNQKLWPVDGGEEITPESLVARIIHDAPPGTEGVTLSGGEIFQQSTAAVRLISLIHKLRPAWSIGVFTGYTEIEVRSILGSAWAAVQSHLDWIAYGRYDRSDPAVGFEAKDLRILSRYIPDDFITQMEVSVDASGLTNITGFPV